MTSEEKVFIEERPLLCMPKFSDEELLDLHRKGLTDREISEVLGVTQAAVNYRREKMRLQNNYERDTFSDSELLSLYHQGLNDREISEALHVTQAAVNYRRGRLALKSNHVREKAFFTHYGKGLSAEEVAQKLRVPVPAVLHMIEKYESVSEKEREEAKA